MLNNKACHFERSEKSFLFSKKLPSANSVGVMSIDDAIRNGAKHLGFLL